MYLIRPPLPFVPFAGVRPRLLSPASTRTPPPLPHDVAQRILSPSPRPRPDASSPHHDLALLLTLSVFPRSTLPPPSTCRSADQDASWRSILDPMWERASRSEPRFHASHAPMIVGLVLSSHSRSGKTLAARLRARLLQVVCQDVPAPEHPGALQLRVRVGRGPWRRQLHRGTVPRHGEKARVGDLTAELDVTKGATPMYDITTMKNGSDMHKGSTARTCTSSLAVGNFRRAELFISESFLFVLYDMKLDDEFYD